MSKQFVIFREHRDHPETGAVLIGGKEYERGTPVAVSIERARALVAPDREDGLQPFVFEADPPLADTSAEEPAQA